MLSAAVILYFSIIPWKLIVQIKTKTMSRSFTLLTALLAGSASFAQQDSIRTRQLDDVIVTANKTEQKQSTTGKVISVITKQQIERSTGKTVAQLLNEQVGITINGALNNPGGVQSVFMRGAASGRTLILLDGIPVNDPSQITNDFDLNLFSINDIERIEICKGAQSTLYGSDAVAGVINIITVKKDISKPFNVKATMTAGNKSTTRNNLQVYGKTGKLTYTGRFARLSTKGFSAAYDSTGTKNFDNDGYDGTVTSGSVLYQATSQLAVKAFTMFSQYNADIDAGAFADKRNYTIDNKNLTAGAGFVFKRDRWSLNGNYQYSKMHRNYNDNATIPGATAYSMNDYDAITQFAELYASVKLVKGLTLLAGGDYRFGSMNNQYVSMSSFGPYNSSFPDKGMNQASAYASLAFGLKGFNVELGGRYNNHSRYGNNFTYTFNPSYTISEHYRVFGSIASAFKAPSLYQIYSTGTEVALDPERSVNYEVGVQQQYKGFSNRIVFFYRDITNGIDYNNVSTPGRYFNFAKQEARGIEYEVTVAPTATWTITGNYAYTSLEEATQSRVNFKDTLYNYSLRRPKHSINLTTGYQFTKGLYASISGKYVAGRYDVGGYKKQDLFLDNYVIFSAYAEYKTSESLKFFADVQNFTNRKFYDTRGYNAIPVIFNAGLTFNW